MTKNLLDDADALIGKRVMVGKIPATINATVVSKNDKIYVAVRVDAEMYIGIEHKWISVDRIVFTEA